MDFGQALRALRSGAKVRRTAWAADPFVHDPIEWSHLELTVPAEGYTPLLIVTQNNGLKSMFNPSHAQLLTDDWEIVD